MTQEPKFGICSNCREREEQELFEVEIEEKVKEICDACKIGMDLENENERSYENIKTKTS